MQAFIQTLIQAIGEKNILTDPAECLAYGYDNSRRQGHPEVVVFAENTLQIQKVISLCNQHKVPLTARGRGTGTPGGAVPVMGGLVLSCERMQQVVKVDPANRLMVVEPGVLNQTVQTLAAQHGFFWAPDPSSAAFCTVGGNLAYNAAGPRAIKYGAARENTLALTAVTGGGEIIHTGSATTKGATGYDLTRLLIGSEGTLAIITEATLKLTPLPEAKQTIRAVYRHIAAAAEAVARIMAQPVVPCSLEFIDAKAIALIRAQGVDLPAQAGALLLIEIDGLATELPAAARKIEQAALQTDLLEIKIAADAAEAEQLWDARKALSPALRTLAPGKINEDVVVPVAHVPLLIEKLNTLSEKYHINIVNFGHAGNGNIHINLLIDSNDAQQRQGAEQCLAEIFDSVLALNGTLSGEHGIGIEKRDFMAKAIDANTLNIMRQIKEVFDPNAILNPGKIFPAY